MRINNGRDTAGDRPESKHTHTHSLMSQRVHTVSIRSQNDTDREYNPFYF